MENKFRCNCPVTTALDILGDKWVLVIIKQMLIQGLQTFKEFMEGEEAIATNILAGKLKSLEQNGIIVKTKLPHNNKTNLYFLTDRGLALAPLIVELLLWGGDNLKKLNPSMQRSSKLKYIKNNKEEFVQKLQEDYKERLRKTRYE